MSPGPRREPTALKLLKGNPGKQKLPKGEMKPPSGAPDLPSWLAVEAKAEWRRVVPKLEALGVLSLVDGAALAGYCQSYARWVEAEKAIAKVGAVKAMGENGYEAISPWVTVAQKYLQQVRAFCSEFGLTPSARARMVLPGEKTPDEMDGLLSEAK